MTDKQEHSQDTQPEKPLIDIKTGNQTVDQSIVRVSRFAAWFQAIPAVAHFIRALERFNDRLGSQFGAAITDSDGVVCRCGFCTRLQSGSADRYHQ